MNKDCTRLLCRMHKAADCFDVARRLEQVGSVRYLLEVVPVTYACNCCLETQKILKAFGLQLQLDL